MLAAYVHCLTKADTRGTTSVEVRVHSRRARFLWIRTMLNRLKHLLGACEETTKFTDSYEVEALGDTYIVELATALAIERHLDKAGEAVWVEFRDAFGPRHRVLARYVYRLTESTRETRAALRAFWKARRNEDKEDEDPYENAS
jgi:hypothetical protein